MCVFSFVQDVTFMSVFIASNQSVVFCMEICCLCWNIWCHTSWSALPIGCICVRVSPCMYVSTFMFASSLSVCACVCIFIPRYLKWKFVCIHGDVPEQHRKLNIPNSPAVGCLASAASSVCLSFQIHVRLKCALKEAFLWYRNKSYSNRVFLL